jgi:prepilin-type N-terminal cleavage/methylation domain-containing protein
MQPRSWPAFTLAELLIALAILGVIAAFTIPKVLQSQQDVRYKSLAKEAAAAITDAFTQYRASGNLSGNTHMVDLEAYLNYVKVETDLLIDTNPGNASPTYDCAAAGVTCLRLHNGAILMHNTNKFVGTSPLNAIYFFVDPDGTYNGTKSVQFWLYYDGKLRDSSTVEAGTLSLNNPIGGPSSIPPWFNWN